MKHFVTLSTGKDSEATLWWAYHNLPFDSWEVIFDDVDWDDQAVYDHLKYLESRVGKKFIIVKNEGWHDKLNKKTQDDIINIFGKRNIFAELVLFKGRFPSTKARFCTEELKVKPMIDYIIDNVKEDCVIIQGVRADESESRRNMKAKDEYFKFYFEPHKYNDKGKPQYHSYRKKDVVDHLEKYTVDVIRPILKKTAIDVFQIIFDNNSPGNPLYRRGASRVGCYPCVMCKKAEIKQIATDTPARIEQLEQLEQLGSTTFFPPGFIPSRFCSRTAICMIYREDLVRLFLGKIKNKGKDVNQMFLEHKSDPEEMLYQMYFKNEKIEVMLDEDDEEYILRKVKVPTIRDVVTYVMDNPNQTSMFEESKGCVSVYNICEV